MENFESVLSVSDVNGRIAGFLNGNPWLTDLWIRGEISGMNVASSGHAYFDLKDAKSKISCVIWKSTFYSGKINRLDLQNGNALELHGKIRVYEPGGKYNFEVDEVRAAGQGSIYEEFLKLKDRLEKEGLFDAAHKLPLPGIPRTVGVVTSASGAAVKDIVKTINERWPLCEVWIAPALVQGEGASTSLVSALNALIAEKPDVIIIGRGGGSMEDLWAFNDETLARTIYACEIPIISAVGHERDITLVDYVADERASTPTGAAVAAVPDAKDYQIGLDSLMERMTNGIRNRLNAMMTAQAALEKRLELRAPTEQIAREKAMLAQIKLRLENAMRHELDQKTRECDALTRRLESVSPNSVMKRGYAVVRKEGHVAAAAALNSGDPVRITFSDGEKSAIIQ